MKHNEKETRLKKGDTICVRLENGMLSVMRKDGTLLKFSGGDDKYLITGNASSIQDVEALTIVTLMAEVASLRVKGILKRTKDHLVVELTS